MRNARRRPLSLRVSGGTGLLLLVLAFGLVSAAGAAGASPVMPSPLALSATPAQVMLVGRTAGTIEVTNVGGVAVTVYTRTADVVFDRRGRAKIDPPVAPERSARSWVRVSPRRLVLRPGSSGHVTVRSRPPRRAERGDHHALVMLTTSAVPRGGVATRTRIGVLTLVRIPGRIVRRLELRGLSVQSAHDVRLIELRIVNRGNVSEQLPRGGVTLSLEREGRVLTMLHAGSRRVLPGMSTKIGVRYAGPLRGRVKARVRLELSSASLAGAGAPELPPLRRVFWLRL